MANFRYTGISPFTSKQKDIFFGRDLDIAALYEKIRIEQQVLLYAKSGIGKSSLLNAGVLPMFQENNEYVPLNIRFTAYTPKNAVAPLQRIFNALNNLIDSTNGEKSVIEEITPDSEKQSLWYIFKKLQLTKPDLHIILVFDQFEELFSYPDADIDELKTELSEILNGKVPSRFVDLFGEIRSTNRELMNRKNMRLLNESIDIKTVYIIRSDRMSQLNRLRDRIPNIQKSYYELLPLTKEQASEAIVNPAKKQGDFDSPEFGYEQQALDKILNYLTKNNTQNVETTQLQIICQRIENGFVGRDRPRPVSTDDDSRCVSTNEIPDFKNIFFDFYNDAIATITENQQFGARKLVEDELIRNQQRISLDGNICQDYIPDTELQKLVNAHLLRAERNTVGGFSYELSHDTLIDPIYEAAEKRRQEEEEEKQLRIRNDELRIAKEKAQRDRRRLLYVVLALIFAVSLSAIAIWKWIDAEKQKNIATEQTEKAVTQEKLAKIAQDKAEKALNDFKEEQARWTMMKFKTLKARALTIIDAGLNSNDIIKEMTEIAKEHPDSSELYKIIDGMK